MITEANEINVGDIEDANFAGKRIGDMEREELLAVINWLSEENSRLEDERFEKEMKYIEAMKELAY